MLSFLTKLHYHPSMLLQNTNTYYTARAAQELLGVNRNTFGYYLQKAKKYSFFKSREFHLSPCAKGETRVQPHYNLATIIYVAHQIADNNLTKPQSSINQTILPSAPDPAKSFLELFYQDMLCARMAKYGLPSNKPIRINTKKEFEDFYAAPE